ncbi:stage II sporulation protein P [Paenibacillus sp. CAU 1782]
MLKQTWMKNMNGTSPLKELGQGTGSDHAAPMRPLMLEHGGELDDYGRHRHRGGGEKMRSILVTGRAYVAMSLSSMLFFIVLGVAVAWHGSNPNFDSSGMKGIAASLSSGFFGEMLEMEMPAFQSSLESESLTGKEIGAFLMRTLTDINPARPESLVASQMAGMTDNRYFLIRKGAGGDVEVGPRDHPPTYDPLEGLNENDGEAVAGTDKEPASPDEGGEDGEVGAPPDKGALTTGNSKVVFVYHSHNRESWYPELGADAKDATSKTTNITLVGKRLADKLEELGVGSMHSDTDYSTAIKDYRWELSYKYSLKTVKEALASSNELKFMFDIHRDSQKREYTTVDIDGKSYAQVYFIIGHRNPDWKENEKVASKIHEALEKDYPGISRGIWGKTANTGNAEYNQSLSPGNVLVEIGGVENTLEESYRTADALAKAVSSIYWEAEKVSGEE